jgi:hypothetical protein
MELIINDVQYVVTTSIINFYTNEKNQKAYTVIFLRDSKHQFPFETDEVLVEGKRTVYYLNITHDVLYLVKKLLGINCFKR